MLENQSYNSDINPLNRHFKKTGIAYCQHSIDETMAVVLYASSFDVNPSA
jgi:hypothetical protein